MKRFGYLLLILAVALGLAACRSREKVVIPEVTQAAAVPTEATEATEAVVEKTVVTAVVARHSQQTPQWWHSFEQKLEEENPHLDLEVTCVSWHDMDAVIQERISAGNMPDLVNTDTFRQYQEAGLLVPADQWVSPETYGKFYPGLHARATADGVVWGIPDYVTARAMYYNADILTDAGVEVPTTWNELISACQNIRAYDYEIYPWGVDMTTDEGYACFAYYIWNNGSDFMDDSGNWTLDAQANREAVEFITGMVNSRLTNPDPTDQTRYACQDLFGQGKIAMMIAPNTLPAYCAAGGNLVNYGIAPLPANGSKQSISTASGNFLLCFGDESRTAEELAAITAVTDAFYEDAAYAAWVQMEGFLPATTTANALLGQQDPNMAVWNQILNAVKFYPSHKEQWPNVKDGAVEVLQNTLWKGNTWLLLDQFQKNISGA